MMFAFFVISELIIITYTNLHSTTPEVDPFSHASLAFFLVSLIVVFADADVPKRVVVHSHV